jgi:hypothetical protein
MAKATNTTPKRITRQQVEKLIAILVDHLDQFDDPDLEPSLGFSTGGCFPENQSQVGDAADAGLDLEDEHDGCEPDGDREPSLGWTSTFNQTSTDWAANHMHGATDLEQGVGPVKKKRPASKTGNSVVYCAEVLR